MLGQWALGIAADKVIVSLRFIENDPGKPIHLDSISMFHIERTDKTFLIIQRKNKELVRVAVTLMTPGVGKRIIALYLFGPGME